MNPTILISTGNIFYAAGLNYYREDKIMKNRRAVVLLLTIGLMVGLSACIEPEIRLYSGDSFVQHDSADRYDIAARINNQQRRIDQGISSGELTRREADVLIDNLNWIRDEYSGARRDGRLSQPELERLSQHLEQNSRMIRDKKNNEIRRIYSAPPQPPVPAVSAQPDFLSRIDNQQRRIDQGIVKGDLTRREADMLQDNLNNIKDDYSRMKSDGRLTPGEADRLERDLDSNSRMIQDKRNNQIRRLYAPTPTPVPAPRIDQVKPTGFQLRIEQQQKRIDDGIRSGELTRKEAEVVQENLDKIKTAYLRMKADGRLSEKEQNKLENMLERNDKMIYNKKHNAIERFD